jgi:hypothetical protein
MSVYIVKEGKEVQIITVRPHQEEYFQADYAGKILASGNNTLEAFLKFADLPRLPNPTEEESSQ